MSSLRPSALASLDDSLALPYESLGELKAVQSVQISEIIKQLNKAEEAARNLRSFVTSVLPEASWQSREELEVLVARVEKMLAARSRLLALATELESGRIVHRRALRVEQLNQLRKEAIDELRIQAESGAEPPTLPGPEADQWIEWACGLKEPEDAESLQTLRSGFAHLDDFVTDLEPGMWAGTTTPEASSPNGEELGNLIQEVREQLRSRLLALATELERGLIVHHRALRVNQLSQLREQAIEELRSQAESETEPPTTLPGPEAEKWIEWACGLKEPEDAESLQTLRSGFARLDDFIANLEPDMWRAGGSPDLDVLSEPQKSADRARDDQTRRGTNGFEESVVSSEAIAVESKDAETSAEAAQAALESHTATPHDVTPLRTGEEVEPMPAPARALSARVTDLFGRLRHRGELSPNAARSSEMSAAPGVFSDIAARVEKIGGGRVWLPLVLTAVLILAVLGAMLWRSQNQTRINRVTAVEGKIENLAPSNPESKGSDQSGIATNSETGTASPTLRTEKQPELPSTTKGATEASKRDDGASRSPVITIPNDTARIKKEKAPANGAAEGSDPAPPALSGGVPNSLANNIVVNVPVAQPKLAAQPVRVSPGGEQGLVIHQVAPKYPAEARRQGIQGTVVLQAVVGKDGNVLKVQVVTGNPMLTQAAVNAVKQWRFNPYYRDGQPVEGETQVKVNFTF